MKRSALVFVIAISLTPALAVSLNAQQGDLKALSKNLLQKSQARQGEAKALAVAKGWPVAGYNKDGSYYELQAIINGHPRYFMTFNRDAAHSTRTDSTQAAIGGGSGFTLREWDAGKVMSTHQELVGRVTWADEITPAVHFHSTHVAGTLIASGVRPKAKGMSYQANLRAFEWNNDVSEMASEAASGMTLSNQSYGYSSGWTWNSSNSSWYWYGDTAVSEVEDCSFGMYDEYAQAYDQVANNAPNYLSVASAGNDRSDHGPGAGGKHYYYDVRYSNWRISYKTRNWDGGTAGYDCIPFGMQIAKNTLTVGAVMDVPDYTGPGSVAMTTFSSWGPTDDGRIKPDICGNGYALYSCYISADTSYASYSGTSMAAPNVTGSLGLLEDFYMDHHGGSAMRAATLKGLVINTAREAGPNQGPDYMFGWGLLDTYAAYQLLNKDYLNDAKGYIEQLTLNNGQTTDLKYRVYGAPAILKATISWNDPAGTPPPYGLNNRTPVLVNDLDLRVLKGVSTYYPWHLDVNNPANAATQADNSVDNVEQVEVNLPAAGLYTIRISHKGTLQGGSQQFSLIVSGAEKSHAWHVYADGSGDFPTIAAAVAGAADGDSIFVHGGTYHEHDISVSSQLVIKGISDNGAAIVDAQSLGRCFAFPAATKTILFDGLTLKNGAAPSSFSYHGGGIYCANSLVTISNCSITNSSASAGGGVWVGSSAPAIVNTTISGNSATNGGGVYVGPGGNPTLTRTIVSFSSAGGGIWGDAAATGAVISCCDVYGNTGGNYGGTISDRTGTSNDISKDPIFCDAAAGDYAISSISPCAPGASPCGQLIGSYGVGCVKGPELAVAGVQFSSTQPDFGDSITATVKVKNLGQLAAGRFWVDYYKDLASAPPPGTLGDERHLVTGLAAGDSVTWTTSFAKAASFEAWTSYFRVDTQDSVLETNEGDNLSGPHEILWRIATEQGWPVAFSAGFHSSPAIASLDAAEGDLEIIIGCDDGKIYALRKDGTNAPGWPVTVGDTLYSSPAVADITGDYHKEVVIGAKDGKIYAFSYLGAKLWEHATGSPIYTTPVLADLDRDGKCEVICGSGGNIYALEGNGSSFAGSWPYSAGAGIFASPAVGDLDGDGYLEIAAVAHGLTGPVHSLVYLLERNGSLASGSWPVEIDTVITTDPVVREGSGGKIFVGAQNGKLYQFAIDGSYVESSGVPGSIGASGSLYDPPLDIGGETVVPSRLYAVSPSGHWEGYLTAIDHTGAILPGWPVSTASWMLDQGSPAAPITIGSRWESIAGSPAGSVQSRGREGVAVYGFPLDAGDPVLVSAAADDIDRDGRIELVLASGWGGGSIRVYKLDAASYDAAQLWWPMFRHDRARTGCSAAQVTSGVDEPRTLVPAASAIRSIFPNPFNPTTTVVFDLAARSPVELAIFDVAGRRVATLVEGEMEAGRHEAPWNGHMSDGRVAASGIYFCRLKAPGLVETRKLVLLR